MDEVHVAGGAVSIVQNGRIVLSKGYGFAAFDPVRRVDPDTTLFRIGSITKTFTWIAVMRAVEAGKIDLDAPVNTYLPAQLRVPDEGFEQPIRMRDLMAHAAGFEDRAAGILFGFDPERVPSLEEFLRDYRPRRVREPGALTSYSNYGTALAGAVVAAVRACPGRTSSSATFSRRSASRIRRAASLTSRARISRHRCRRCSHERLERVPLERRGERRTRLRVHHAGGAGRRDVRERARHRAIPAAPPRRRNARRRQRVRTDGGSRFSDAAHEAAARRRRVRRRLLRHRTARGFPRLRARRRDLVVLLGAWWSCRSSISASS